MKIRLDQVEEPLAWQETLEVCAAELGLPEQVEIGDIECQGNVTSMADSFLLRATLAYQQKLGCTRCLKPVSVPCSNDLDLILEIDHHQSSDQDRELEQDDFDLLLLEDAILDTRPIIIEQIHLSIPMKPLCKKDCAGLCTSCGADLNLGPCGCESVADPRWQALAALKRPE